MRRASLEAILVRLLGQQGDPEPLDASSLLHRQQGKRKRTRTVPDTSKDSV